MNIARCKMDKKGRINLPATFLKGNHISHDTHDVIIQVIPNNGNTIKLVFDLIKKPYDIIDNE